MNGCFPDPKTIIVTLGVTFIVIVLTSEPQDLVMMWKKSITRTKEIYKHLKNLVKH